VQRHYLVAFSVADPSRLLALTESLRGSDAWWNFIPNVWVICTAESIDQVFQRCQVHVTLAEAGGDYIWIHELVQTGQRGWLPAEAWEWLQGHHLGKSY